MHRIFYIITFLISDSISALSTDFFRRWICIGIKQNIDFTVPYKANIGELPLVIWRNPKTKKLFSCINICPHMGSKLDNGIITDSGCLKCQYHGLELFESDTFGEIKEHEGKLFWSHRPYKPIPDSIPFYNNLNFEKSFLQIDMESSLTDSAYNSMDLRHPEYVHNTIVGFGSNVPPENIKYFKYRTDKTRIGMSFDYSSNSMMRAINNNVKKTNNFHMFVYPTFSWSKVSFSGNDLIIGLNLLPIGENNTRWFVTICHNYYTTEFGKNFVQLMANTILSQDYVQMKNQYPNNKLKQEMIFTRIFKNEEPILEIKRMFEAYKYPDIDECVELYKSDIKK
jgi:phenylpropionate dioxygenase-like ring-hydroxylating dioxygenase large terminal subunit